jgi:precorrin-4 C11-methyltransferase
MGTVYFVGAGPGDPELLTLKAQRLIAAADVIIYAGSLVNPAVLSHARPDAAIHNSSGMRLEEQVAVMRDAVARGETVVRLHTGDPAIFGATLEQMRSLERLGITRQVVPGVSSVFAAAAALGIELTVAGDTQTVILTRLAGETPMPSGEALRDLAVHRTSLVIFLSAGMLERVVDEFASAGYAPDTPIAVVFRASWPDERVMHGTLADIVDQVQSAEITHQALIVVSPALSATVRAEGAAASHLYSTALETPPRQPTTAIVTLTRAGTELGERLHSLMPKSVLYAPARHMSDPGENTAPYSASVRQALQAAFRQHTALVCIMASGIVVRELAPLFTSKHSDPGVVVVDEQGHYAVSLLAGHKGGANRLACQVARLLGGQAVLTTASDVQGLPALDLLGSEQGWALQRAERITAVGAALVNGEAVGMVQDCGDADWLSEPLPTNLTRYATLDELQAATPAAAVIVTYRRVPEQICRAVPDSIIYNPRVLVPGVGCNRGTPASEVLSAIDETLAEAGLEVGSVSRVATIADKADEPGLLEACAARDWPLRVFTRCEIASQAGLPNPSPWAQRVLGVPGVAEPAALLGAGTDRLLVEKRKFPNVTVAVALRREDAP